MSDRRFRFGVVATPQDGDQCRASAHRVSELGYSTLLMRDGLQLLSPFPALAAAAATAEVRIGTFVLAAPVRPPRSSAWETHSLTVLTGGRLELGIGAGRPHAVTQAALELGLPLQSPAERLAAVSETVDHLRTLDGSTRTPILIAAGGPPGPGPRSGKGRHRHPRRRPADLPDRAHPHGLEIRTHAGDRADDMELAMNLFEIGDEVPGWAEHHIGADTAALVAHDSLTLLRGHPQAMADERGGSLAVADPRDPSRWSCGRNPCTPHVQC